MDMLTAQVRRKLNITWHDPDTDARVADIISSADAHLRYQLGIADPKFSFEEAGIENTLFLSYCFYEWNHALNEWEANYRSTIMSARSKHEVEQYADESG